MFQKKVVFCPVGNHIELGYIAKGELSSFVCKECGWMFTWDSKGKLLPPVKVDLHAKQLKPRRYCGPDGCYCR